MMLFFLVLFVVFIIGYFLYGNKDTLDEELFYIEYYPETNKYYPRYKSYFLKKDYYTGIVRTESMIDIADSFNTKEKAEKLIGLFEEQRHKENVQKIPYGNRQGTEK